MRNSRRLRWCSFPRQAACAKGWMAVGLIALTSACARSPREQANSDQGSDTQAAVAAGPAPEGMVLIPHGSFALGSGDERFPDRAAVDAQVEAFYIDIHEVTNAQFRAFVQDAGYVTESERIGNSVTFIPPDLPEQEQPPVDSILGGQSPWFVIAGASWMHPMGPGSTIEGRDAHPVVHVSRGDAEAYAQWAGKRLPSEAEWERAARGGRAGEPFVWGQTYVEFEAPANVWQGRFPVENLQVDGYVTTAPVKSFAANPYGLFDMAGNVWEWVSTNRGEGAGGELHERWRPGMEPGLGALIKGGSFLCAESYCQGYRPSERQFKLAEDASSNLGFRCARDL